MDSGCLKEIGCLIEEKTIEKYLTGLWLLAILNKVGLLIVGHTLNRGLTITIKFMESKCCVLFSGLESYPQHELAKRQMTGFGGMVTFFIKGDLENAKQFFKSSEV